RLLRPRHRQRRRGRHPRPLTRPLSYRSRPRVSGRSTGKDVTEWHQVTDFFDPAPCIVIIEWSVPIKVGAVTRRSKIVCTLGPATSSPERIRDLIAAGMDVARFNLSHGSHELHKEIYDRVREAADELGRGVGLLADLQGPKIRLGKFAEGP